jgi:branched-chain amino acid transport system substrate-binding protein
MVHKTLTAVAAAALLAGLPMAQAQISEKVLRIGIMNDASGPYSDITGKYSVDVARMAIEDAGQLPGGAKIELLVADHQNKADLASNIAREWFDSKGVDVIVDVPFSSAALAVQAVAKERKKAVLYTSAGIDRLTEADCSATSVHFWLDSHAAVHVTGKAAVDAGDKTWFFMTSDYVAGNATSKAIMDVVKAAGGQVVGEVKFPTNISEFSSYLLQAQASKAKVVMTTAPGNDLINLAKQWNEFGLAKNQKLAAAYTFLSDVHTLGLQNAQGMLITQSFYWDLDNDSRAWSRRYMQRHGGRAPNDTQAALYSAMQHYFRAVKSLDSDDPARTIAWMRQNPVDNFYAKGAKILPNGRLAKDMYLMQVKAPSESRGPWDYLKLVKIVPPTEAFRPIAQSACPLAKQ